MSLVDHTSGTSGAVSSGQGDAHTSTPLSGGTGASGATPDSSNPAAPEASAPKKRRVQKTPDELARDAEAAFNARQEEQRRQQLFTAHGRYEKGNYPGAVEAAMELARRYPPWSEDGYKVAIMAHCAMSEPEKANALYAKMTDKPAIEQTARDIAALGFTIIATSGTAQYLSAKGIAVQPVNKVAEGQPHVVDALINGKIQLVFNTTEGAQSLLDSASIRRASLAQGIPYYTTISGARAATQAIRVLKTRPLEAGALQTYS